MRHSSSKALFLIAIVAAFVIAACAAQAPAPAPTQAPAPTAAPTQAPAPTEVPKPSVYKVGLVNHLTGDAAAYGQSMKKGAELLKKKIKKKVFIEPVCFIEKSYKI